MGLGPVVEVSKLESITGLYAGIVRNQLSEVKNAAAILRCQED